MVVKFWLAISKDEQLRRFEAREQSLQALQDHARGLAQPREVGRVPAGGRRLIDRTSTPYAPWDLVAAEDKRGARISVLETLCHRLDAAL